MKCTPTLFKRLENTRHWTDGSTIHNVHIKVFAMRLYNIYDEISCFFSWKFFLTDSGSHVLFWPVLCVCTLCRQNLIGIKLKLMQIDVFIIFQMKTEIMTLSFLLSSWSIGNVPRNDETSMYFFLFWTKTISQLGNQKNPISMLLLG